MKRITMLLAIVLGVGFVASSLPAQEVDKPADPKPRPKRQKPRTPRKPRLRGMHAQMAKVCGLSKEQQQQVADLQKQRTTALKQFQETNKAKLAAAREAYKKAKEAKDKKAMKAARAVMTPLNVERRKLDAGWLKKIMGVLTPEQKVKWDKHTLTQRVLKGFRRAKLTKEQIGKVKLAVDEQTTPGEGQSPKDLTDPKVRTALAKKIGQHVKDSILTDEQRELLKKKPVRPKKPAKPKVTREAPDIPAPSVVE